MTSELGLKSKLSTKLTCVFYTLYTYRTGSNFPGIFHSDLSTWDVSIYVIKLAFKEFEIWSISDFGLLEWGFSMSTCLFK